MRRKVGGRPEFMRLSQDIEGLVSNAQRVPDGYLRGEFDGPNKDPGL
jgi:hypothetical protein